MDFIKSEYESKNTEMQSYLEGLGNLISNSNSPLEGNCFYYDQTLTRFPELFSKQLNIFWCGKQGTSRVCEIGFNGGHSTMLLLLGREKTPLKFTIFDVGHHAYTKPCVEYVKSTFSHVDFEYIEGDSTFTMPEWINSNKELIETYDVVHVDGGHTERCIFNDMRNADLLVKTGGIVIVDDTNAEHINKYVDLYITHGNYIELNLLKSHGYEHRIIKKVKK